MPFSPIIQSILTKRGITDFESFLRPKTPQDYSLFDLKVNQKEFKQAVLLIKQARKNQSSIVIYGDYDADGITSTAIIWEALYYSGCNIKPFIPNRQKHGYGLSISGLKNVIKQHHPTLIITVDNGITAYKAIEFAKKNKIKVIVIDHHQRIKKKHPADSVIHSTIPSAAGLVWLFIKESLNKVKLKINVQDLLELAAIGTVTDMVPLLGINRSIVKYGLDNIRKSKRIGIKNLSQAAGIPLETIDSHNLGFHLGPRLNSMGRLDDALDSLRLLCTNNPAQAQELARKLNNTNRERQELTDRLTEIAIEIGQSQKNNPVIIVSHSEFHEGVIGLVASKLVQKYWRPAIVLSQNEQFYKASARSIPGFNIISAIRKLDKMLESAGGHPMAAGFNIKNCYLENFINKFSTLAKPLITPDMLIRKLDIDATINFNELNINLANELELLAPFGVGNPRPILSTDNVNVINTRTVGKDNQHLKLHLSQNKINYSAVGFNMGHLHDKLTPDVPVTIAYHLIRNTWNGNTNLELQLKSIKTQ